MMNPRFSTIKHNKNWKGYLSCVLLMMSLTLMEPGEAVEITPKEKTKIMDGLQVAKAIASFLESEKFSSAVTKFTKNVGKYLGVIGPFTSLALSLSLGDSPEVKLMKTMMKNIDSSFDKMDSRFDDIERLIEWSSVQVQFSQIESSIKLMEAELKILYETQASARQQAQAVFLEKYDKNFKSPGLKIYQALTQPKGVFHESVGEAVIRYTKYDRKKVQVFLIGVIKLILQASKIELAYYTIKSYTSYATNMKGEWEKRFNNLQTKFLSLDANVKANFHSQSGKDLDHYLAQYWKLSNQQFSQKFYDHLASKFYWRDWGVVVFNSISTTYHKETVCGGHIRLQRNGRNVLIASKEKDTAYHDRDYAAYVIIKESKPASHWRYILGDYAETVYNRINRHTIRGSCIIAVIDRREDVHLAPPLSDANRSYLNITRLGSHEYGYEDVFYRFVTLNNPNYSNIAIVWG